MSRPKSRPNRWKHPDRLPDWDNLAKAVVDALQGTVFPNDSQIVIALVRKWYTYFDDRPGVDITIEELQPAEVEKDLVRMGHPKEVEHEPVRR